MRDNTGQTLKAYYKGKLYHVGMLNIIDRKVQIALPVNEDSHKAYFTQIVNLKDVTFVLE